MVVGDIMSVDPITVEVSERVGEVIKRLVEADVRHLPVTNEGELVGIVSDRDLRNFSVPALLELDHIDEIQQAMLEPISEVMTSDVVTVDPETELSELVELMVEHKFGALPVTEADSSKLVGIVSYVDVLRVLGSQL